jgi:hypothetical protein
MTLKFGLKQIISRLSDLKGEGMVRKRNKYKKSLFKNGLIYLNFLYKSGVTIHF